MWLNFGSTTRSTSRSCLLLEVLEGAVVLKDHVIRQMPQQLSSLGALSWCAPAALLQCGVEIVGIRYVVVRAVDKEEREAVDVFVLIGARY
jgi:hypothetical protein